jgi:hypothetical protein
MNYRRIVPIPLEVPEPIECRDRYVVCVAGLLFGISHDLLFRSGSERADREVSLR